MAALPETLARRLVRAAKRPMLAARSDEAFDVLDRPVRAGDFSVLDGHDHCLLVTYRKDGTPVPTPVWFARQGAGIVVWTEVEAYKAKRLRRDPRALVAPCTVTGKPLGDPVEAVGRVLESDAERAAAARAIKAQWNLGQRIFERASRPVTEVHYLAFEPAHR